MFYDILDGSLRSELIFDFLPVGGVLVCSAYLLHEHYCCGYAVMASRRSRWHKKILPILLLLAAINKCGGYTGVDKVNHRATSASSGASAHEHNPRKRNSGTAMGRETQDGRLKVRSTPPSPSPIPDRKHLESKEVRMFDFSFGHLGPDGHLPDLPQPPSQPEPSSHAMDGGAAAAALPLALSLRECSLGDAGVAKVARSPWVRGGEAASALSLRHNHVSAVFTTVLYVSSLSQSSLRSIRVNAV